MIKFFFQLFNFLLKTVLVTNRLTSGILFSPSTIFVLKAVLVTNSLTSGILFSTFPILY